MVVIEAMQMTFVVVPIAGAVMLVAAAGMRRGRLVGQLAIAVSG